MRVDSEDSSASAILFFYDCGRRSIASAIWINFQRIPSTTKAPNVELTTISVVDTPSPAIAAMTETARGACSKHKHDLAELS